MKEGMRKAVISPTGGETEVLDVPFYFQRDRETYCVPFSLMMTTHYFAKKYHDLYVKENTPNLSIDEILKITKTRHLGTIVDTGLIKRLNEAFPSLVFELAREISVDALIRRFEKNLPTIAIYDASYLLYEIPGAHHAGVVVGFINDDFIVLNNTFLGNFKPVDRVMFERSWELEDKRAILINPQKQRKLEDF